MRRKSATRRAPDPGAFDGRKIRSALKWKILATLLGRVAAPVAAAQLWEFIRTGSSRNLSEWLHRVRHPSHVYVYLHRMAEEGLVVLDRLGEALEATLTDKGRTELERYSAYWRGRGVADPEALVREQGGEGRGARSGAAEPKPRSRTVTEAGSAAGTSAEQPHSTAGDATAGNRPRRDGPAALAAACLRRVRRKRAGGRSDGSGGGTGFVSYDLPMPEHGRRRRLLAVLKAAGYAPVHASMYAGPGRSLGPVIQTLEAAGFAPHLRWGSLRLMPR